MVNEIVAEIPVSMAEKNFFGIYDYVVFAAVLAISSLIGIYYRCTGGKQKTFKEYMLADQTMSVLPVSFSLMASFMSAITLLGVSKENYIYGTQFIMINISYVIATPIVCLVYLPVFFQLQNATVYEYLERRFGWLTRLFASLAFSIQMILYMGIVLYAPALALSAVTGISSNWSVVAVGVVCTFYSTMGGMKAVLVTDLFQSLLMFTAVFAVIGKGMADIGLIDIFARAESGQRLEFFNISPDPRERHTVWSLGIGSVFTYCSIYGVNQAQVQRLLTVKSLHRAQTALWIQLPILSLLSLSTSLSGLVIYAQYYSCDPLANRVIENSDQLMPYYVVERMGSLPGLPGLFVSGIFSGSLSTISSGMNSLAAVTVQDYLKPILSRTKYWDDGKVTLMSKILACVYGILCMAIAFCSQLLGTGVLQASLTIFGAVGGPLLALFTLGMTCRCANQKGVLSGLILGLLLTLWIGFGQPKYPSPTKPVSIEGCNNANSSSLLYATNMANESLFFVESHHIDGKKSASMELPTPELSKDSSSFLLDLYSISYSWISTLGFLTTLTVGLIVSCFSGGNVVDDADLYCSWLPGKRTKSTVSVYTLDILVRNCNL